MNPLGRPLKRTSTPRSSREEAISILEGAMDKDKDTKSELEARGRDILGRKYSKFVAFFISILILLVFIYVYASCRQEYYSIVI